MKLEKSNKNLDDFQHIINYDNAYFHNPYPSYLDIKSLITMKERSYPIHGLDIIKNGKVKTYNFEDILHLVKGNKIPRGSTTDKGYDYILKKLENIVNKYYK